MLTASVIEGFVKAVLAARYDSPAPVPAFHRELWELCCSPHPQVAIAAPREHAKSTAITGAYVLASVCFREADHVLIIGANEELGAGFVKEIATEFNENEVLRESFGFAKFIKETDHEIIGQFQDGHKFRILAKGAGQRMRGIKWERKRPNLVVGDDMEDDEIVMNQERREKFKRWFYGAVRPIIKVGGKIRVVGTILHMDSLLENFMPSVKDPLTVVEDLKTWNREPMGWHSVKYRAHNHDHSQILWPDRFPKEHWLRLRADFSRQGLLDIYGQEYLNDPIDESSAYFQERDFRDLPDTWRHAKNPRKKFYYAGIDFAISKEQRADYTAIAVVSRDADNNIQVECVRKGRWDSKEIIDEMFLIHKMYEPDLFLAEQGAIQKSIGPFLNEEMSRRNVFLNLETQAPTKDKVQRAQSLRAKMRAGVVFFDHDAEWFPELHEEMKRFPKAAHDDQVDALVWSGLALDMMITPSTPEEDEEDDYQNQVRNAGNDGRSAVTGY